MTADLFTAARLFLHPGQVAEVRAIMTDGVASGYFDSPDALAEKVNVLDTLPDVQGIYVTLNPVNPALLARRANRVQMRLSRSDATTGDNDILRRHWFPIDIDPARPSGVSSTDAEHDAALAKARTVTLFLTNKGFPAPVLADSGNGAHLLYAIDLPNDTASRDLVKRCLEALAFRFDDAVAKIDTANHNAARIWKLYGTVSRKGDNTRDRPHRRSGIISQSAEPPIVGRDILERLANTLPTDPAPEAKNAPPGKALDLRHWLSTHGIGIHAEKPFEGGTLYPLVECPFSSDHRDGAFAIQFPSGAIHAGCHHDSCGGGVQRWQELRERYELKKQRKDVASPPRLPPPGPAPVPSLREIPGMDDAITELRQGNPKQFMLRAFALDHVGDETVAECMILSIASRSIINTKGLHVSVTGESGKGKSHAFGTMIRQLPERYQLYGSMSCKALFYMDDLLPGMAIVLDDTHLSEDMAEVLKGVTTSFQKPFVHRTVTKDRKPLTCTIPERCVWWVAKVEGSGDDQVFNRMLTCWIDDSVMQDEQVLNRTLAANETVPEYGSKERTEVLVSRAMWEVLGQNQYYVIIPFATKIRFQATHNRRNPEMLLDLVKANALLRVLQRERKEVNGLNCIIATREDFDEAVRLYTMLSGTAGGQDTKLTKKESDLLDAIMRMQQEEFTIPQLQKATGQSNGTLHRLLHGYISRGVTYTGLLEKCPAIAYTDRTVVVDDEFYHGSTRRRTNAYTFDTDVYATWRGNTGVWLEENTDSLNKESPDEPRRPDTSKSTDPQTPSSQNPVSHDVQKYTSKDPTFAALQQSSSNTPAVAGGFVKAAMNPDPENTPNNTHLDLSESISSSKRGNTQPGAHTCACVSDPELAGGQDRKIADCARNCEQNTQKPQNSLQHVPPDTPPLLEDRKFPAGASIADRRRIHAIDYKRLDVPEPHILCHCCGKKGSWYVEKLTAARKARPEHEQKARRLCRKCYDALVRRDCASAPPLPGVINLLRMERHAPDIGKCPVCNLSAAVFLNEETGVKLCEACHAREVHRQSGREEAQT